MTGENQSLAINNMKSLFMHPEKAHGCIQIRSIGELPEPQPVLAQRAAGFLVQRLEVIADAHSAHYRVLANLVAGQAVGTAVVRVGQNGIDDGQHTPTVLLVDLDDRLATQRAAIQRVSAWTAMSRSIAAARPSTGTTSSARPSR